MSKSRVEKNENTDAKPDMAGHIIQYMRQCRTEPHPESFLIPVLQKIQIHYGYLSRKRLEVVARTMRIPVAKVSGVADFYHFFSFIPKGRHRINVCMGTACYVKGAGAVLDRIQSLLGIESGQTTPDGAFSIETARCLGACAMAPVVVVDDRVFGCVTADDVPGILSQYGFDTKTKLK